MLLSPEAWANHLKILVFGRNDVNIAVIQQRSPALKVLEPTLET
jgi:hypothetical protein